MKKVDILLMMSFVMEVEEDDLIKELPEYMKIADKMERAAEEKMGIDANTPNRLGWTSTFAIGLDESKVNCGKCAVCGTWVTDREKENHIRQLCNGATVNGQLLCDEHLPKGHKWAF